MIGDPIADNLGIEVDEVQDVLLSRDAWMPGATGFDYAAFAQEGGLAGCISFLVMS